MAGIEILEKSVKYSVMIALGISGVCSAFYALSWLDTGTGSWKTLLEGAATTAGPTVLFALAVNLFLGWREGKKTD